MANHADILDPLELMEDRIYLECEKVDAANTYPCVECGRRHPLDDHDWTCMSPDGSGPLLCNVCSWALLKEYHY